MSRRRYWAVGRKRESASKLFLSLREGPYGEGGSAHNSMRHGIESTAGPRKSR